MTWCIFSCLTITHSTRPLSPPLWLETFQIKMARNLQLILPTSIQQSSDNHLAGIWLVAYSVVVFSLVHIVIPSSHVLTALECTFKVIIQECTLCTIGRHNGLKTEFWSIKPNHQTHDLVILQWSYSQKSLMSTKCLYGTNIFYMNFWWFCESLNPHLTLFTNNKVHSLKMITTAKTSMKWKSFNKNALNFQGMKNF